MLLFLASLTFAAEHASDIIEVADVNTVTGTLEIRVERCSHSLLTITQWNAIREGALVSWAAMRTAWEAQKPGTGAGVWLDTYTAKEKTALLYQFTSRGPRVPVPPLP